MPVRWTAELDRLVSQTVSPSHLATMTLTVLEQFYYKVISVAKIVPNFKEISDNWRK
jgi:hypothetical protein